METDGVNGTSLGTVLALELNKGTTNADNLAKLLDEDLSPLDFMFLKRVRVVRLASLKAPGKHCAQVFDYQQNCTRHGTQALQWVGVSRSVWGRGAIGSRVPIARVALYNRFPHTIKVVVQEM